MCGISAIINKDNKSPNKVLIKKITDLIKHRGPDSEGFYYGNNFSLGHRRLSIIGLGEDGCQPMKEADELVISFNGEIYNYIEIKEKLKTKGYHFNTNTDTEVILKAYLEWGENCVSEFNGMWSFIIYNKQTNILFCSRDRFGIKPFYFRNDDDYFLIGSEIKQLLCLKKEVKLNEKLLLDYLLIGLEDHTEETFFHNIYKLPAGNNLHYNLTSHTFKIKPYYKISLSKNDSNETQSILAYKDSLEKSIKLRMRSDVKVGTCLSGGLDSSAVTSIASAIYSNKHEKFNAIHAKSSETETDESEYAKIVAKHCNINLNVIEPSIEDFISNIDEVIYTQEEPFGSPSVFMQYFVMKKAQELNCKVMLDGQGGDETLLGYEKYYPAYIKSLKGIKKISALLNSSKNSKLTIPQVIQYFFYFTNYKLRLKRLKIKNEFIKAEYLDLFESSTLKNLSNKYLNIKELQKIEITSTQLPHLLRYEDKNSMRNSIETRLPFIDYNTLQKALSTNDSFKIKNGWSKYILRKSITEFLPDNVIWRKNKLGFNAPENTWITSIDDIFIETIKKSSILNKYIDFNKLKEDKLDLRTKWKLFNIAKWEEIYSVSS